MSQQQQQQDMMGYSSSDATTTTATASTATTTSILETISSSTCIASNYVSNLLFNTQTFEQQQQPCTVTMTTTGTTISTTSNTTLSQYYYKYYQYYWNNQYNHRNHILAAMAVTVAAFVTAMSSIDTSSSNIFSSINYDNNDSTINSDDSTMITDTNHIENRSENSQYSSWIPSTEQYTTSNMFQNFSSIGTCNISSKLSILSDIVSIKNVSYCDSAANSSSFLSSAAGSSSSIANNTSGRLKRHSTVIKMNENAAKDTIENKYTIQWDNPLGEGSFGAVYLATHKETNEKFAVKKISKQYTNNFTFQREMDALLHLQNHGGHPYICGLNENYNEGSYFYIVLDLIQGGEMFDHLCANGAYSEADAARLIREVSNALAFLHGIGIVHGDMKPENLMLSSANSDEAVIKLVDFGCAQTSFEDENGDWIDLHGADEDRGSANTPAYCPPEILERKIRRSKKKQQLLNQQDTSTLGMISATMNIGEYLTSFINDATGNTNVDNDDESAGKITPSFDMWALGIILYIMLTGVHPFDLYGNASDNEIERKILGKQKPPLRHSPITAHLSKDAISVIESLIVWDPKKRLTAHELLQHPWVRGETALTKKIADSDKRLSAHRVFKTKIEAKVFADLASLTSARNDDDDVQVPMITHRDEDLTSNKSTKLTERSSRSSSLPSHRKNSVIIQQQSTTNDAGLNHRFNSVGGGNSSTGSNSSSGGEVTTRTSLIEHAFHNMDPEHKGYITVSDASENNDSTIDRKNSNNTKDDDSDSNKMCLSTFSDLLSESMKNRYFPKGHLIYDEGDIGDVMYFINSGTVEVFTQDGFTKTLRSPGDFFGEGALLNPDRKRSASIRCTTPVHAIEISREYFEKYMASDTDVSLNLREKDKSRKRQRAKTILLMQNNMSTRQYKKGETLFKAGEAGDSLYILQDGKIDVTYKNHSVFALKPGEMCGEHSLLFHKNRNTTARCISGNGCTVNILSAKDFHTLMDTNISLKESVRDIGIRREFQKAICLATNRSFPQNEDALRKAFDIVDRDKTGFLELQNIQYMILQLDPTSNAEFIMEVLQSLNLEETGRVSWPEFKRIFNLEK